MTIDPDRMVVAVWLMAALSVTVLAVTVSIAAIHLLPLAPV